MSRCVEQKSLFSILNIFRTFAFAALPNVNTNSNCSVSVSFCLWWRFCIHRICVCSFSLCVLLIHSFIKNAFCPEFRTCSVSVRVKFYINWHSRWWFRFFLHTFYFHVCCETDTHTNTNTFFRIYLNINIKCNKWYWYQKKWFLLFHFFSLSVCIYKQTSAFSIWISSIHA